MTFSAPKDKSKYIHSLEVKGYTAVKSRRSTHVKIYDGDKLVTVISLRNNSGLQLAKQYVTAYERTKDGNLASPGHMPGNGQKNTSTTK